MAVFKLIAGPKTALNATGFSTQAAATYLMSDVKSNVANQPLDVMVEVTALTTNVPAGNKQVVVFAQASYDNSVWQTGPNGVATTNEPALTFLGVLQIPNTSDVATKSFSVATGYAGVLPPYVRIILKNDLGVALTSGSVSTSEISASVV